MLFRSFDTYLCPGFGLDDFMPIFGASSNVAEQEGATVVLKWAFFTIEWLPCPVDETLSTILAAQVLALAKSSDAKDSP